MNKKPVVSIGTLQLEKPKSPEKQPSFGYEVQTNITIIDYNSDKYKM